MHAAPELLAAARFAMFAERLTPMLRDMEEIQAMPIEKGASPDTLRRLIPAKQSATETIPLIRSLLFPEDDDG